MVSCAAVGLLYEGSVAVTPGAHRATTLCRATATMNIKPVGILRAIAYPLTESKVLVPLIFFWLMVSFAIWARLFGVLLMLLIVPAVFRYQMILLEARAKGKTPEVPGIEFFNWFGSGWTLFPVVTVAALIWATVEATEKYGTAGGLVIVTLAGVLFPASIAILAITHSPMQSLNPVALARLLGECAGTFWLATILLPVFTWLSIQAEQLPLMLAIFVQLMLSFSFFSLVGSLVRPYGLVENIDLPPSPVPDGTEAAAELQKIREDTLSHAYGFISRGNREGGFRHLFDRIDEDPDPVSAWAWFFERMLLWDSPLPALFYAQHYVHDYLRHGEQVPAVKLILRCQLIDEQFRPFPADIAAAIAAAEACDNQALAVELRGY